MSTLPAQPPPPAASPEPGPARRVLPANPRAAAFVAAGFTAVLYLVQVANALVNLEGAGIRSRTLSGLDGILWAPLLHASWSHLFANTVPVLVFSFLALAAGAGRWIAVTGQIWLGSGLGAWLLGPSGTVTVGASGLAFGWLAFLLVRGLLNRAPGQVAVAVVLLFVWGGMLWSLLPGAPGVSWQGHLFGALSGAFAAWLVARADRARNAGSGTVAA